MKKDLCFLILSAGKGTRMCSSTHKVLHEICGVPLIYNTIKTADALRPKSIAIVVGHQSNIVKKSIVDNLNNWEIKSKIEFIHQKKLIGTAQAIKESLHFLKNYKNVCVLSADAPLIQKETIQKMYAKYLKQKAFACILTADIENPKGYGRIIRDNKGDFSEIVEECNTNKDNAKINEVNSGMYIFNIAQLSKYVDKVKCKSSRCGGKEYYITDIAESINNTSKGKAIIYKTKDANQILGINSIKQLHYVGNILRSRINDRLMNSGVNIISPENTFISPTTKIEKDVIIYPNCFIVDSKISKGCRIGMSSYIMRSCIDNNTLVKYGSYIDSSRIGVNCLIGPFAHIRPDTNIKNNVKVGNFSEVKASTINDGAKVPHLAYVGDAHLGKNVNIGAGTIICNYDGKRKYLTVIEDDVFVGSNSNLIAPIKISSGTKIAAGSTVDKNISSDSLVIERSKLVIKKRYYKKGRK